MTSFPLSYPTRRFLQAVFRTLPAHGHPATLGGSSLALLPARSTQHGAVVMTSAALESVHLTSFSLSRQTSPPSPPHTLPPPLQAHRDKQNPASCQRSRFIPENFLFIDAFPIEYDLMCLFNIISFHCLHKELAAFPCQIMDNGLRQAPCGKPLSSGER